MYCVFAVLIVLIGKMRMIGRGGEGCCVEPPANPCASRENSCKTTVVKFKRKNCPIFSMILEKYPFSFVKCPQCF